MEAWGIPVPWCRDISVDSVRDRMVAQFRVVVDAMLIDGSFGRAVRETS